MMTNRILIIASCVSDLVLLYINLRPYHFKSRPILDKQGRKAAHNYICTYSKTNLPNKGKS